MTRKTKAFVNGQWIDSGDGTFEVFNPFNDQVLEKVADCSSAETQAALDAAETTFETWSNLSVWERSVFLTRIKELLLKHQKDFAELLTLEMGKPIKESMGEVGFAATFFQWYAEEIKRPLGDVLASSSKSKRSLTFRQPVGVAALITPWNFPIGMIGRKVSAALASGCTVVLKPAEDTPLIALKFAEICQEAGLPNGVVNVVPCSRKNADKIGSILCSSSVVKALSFTGSTSVGKKLYRNCSDTVKKVSLELGGNAPFVVFPSADLEVAVQSLMVAKFRNTGQTCVTANRIFVHERIFEKFTEKFLKAMQSLKMGDGLQEDVTQGPIVNRRQLERIDNLVKDALTKGAELRVGGKILQERFYEPTLLTNVSSSMKLFKEELFGPVAALIKFQTEEEVLKMANDSTVGLAGYISTNDISQAWRVSEKLQVGMVGINEAAISSCEMPFGGFKESGIGKEGACQGLDEYSDLKFICFGNV